jgi:tetratricopeptide (TPR) repeat protein
MKNISEISKISKQELHSLLHPTEDERLAIALLVAIPVAVISLILIYLSRGLLLVFILSIVFFVWFILQIAKADLIANSVRVSNKNFPKIYEMLREVKYVLDYDKPVDTYIIEEGTVNALLAKFFKTKFIILHSELVEDMLENNKLLQMKWVIARFVGALKAKHCRLNILRVIVESIEKLKIFNLFILPYMRATQYSGDQIGLAVCGDLDQVMVAFQKLMVGNKLSEKVNFEGMLDQGKDVQGGFFSLLARLSSTHPHMVSRFLNLLAFAKWKYPEMFEKYISKFDYSTLLNIEALLPDYYLNRPIYKIENQIQEQLDIMENVLVSYLSLENFEKALEMSEKMINLAPDNFRGYRRRGDCLIYLNKICDAITSYEEALKYTTERSDERATVLTDRSNVLLMAGKWQEALSDVQKSLEIDPTEHATIINKCIALKKLGKEEEAKKILQDTLPEIKNKYYQACAFAMLGDKENMLRELKEATKQDGGYRVDAKAAPEFVEYRKDPGFRKIVYEEQE